MERHEQPISSVFWLYHTAVYTYLSSQEEYRQTRAKLTKAQLPTFLIIRHHIIVALLIPW